MSEKQKINLREKETKLIQKIEKAKKDLNRLQEKRRTEIGKMAMKHGLDHFDDALLEEAFAQLSKKLANGNT